MKARGGVSGEFRQDPWATKTAYRKHFITNCVSATRQAAWLAGYHSSRPCFVLLLWPTTTLSACSPTAVMQCIMYQAYDEGHVCWFPWQLCYRLLLVHFLSSCHPREWIIIELWGFSRSPIGSTAVTGSWGPKAVLTAVLRGLPQVFKSFCIVTRPRAGQEVSWFDSWLFPSPNWSYRHWCWLPQPPIQWVPGVKRLRYEADLLPPCSAEVMNDWRYTSTTF